MIHKFNYRKNNFLVDVNSGCIHLVDDVTFSVLGVYNPLLFSVGNYGDLENRYSIEELDGAVSELNTLVASGRLFTKSKSCDISTVNSPIKSMCINIAHDCQLCCKYCFASHGNFGGNAKLMDFETSKNAIDFLIRNSGKRVNLEVDFFGGEPLMNFGVVKQTVNYARKCEKIFNKKFRFTITTNGLALDDENIDFINSEMSNVVLSLDGRKDINDFMRITKSGIGCFDIIVQKFQKLVKKRGNKEYFVRGTFTKNNLDFSKDVLCLFNLGFNKISLEPAVLKDDIEFSLEKVDREKILKEYENLADLVLKLSEIDKNFVFFHFMHDFGKMPCIVKTVKGCGCGNEYVSVTPEGDIYPCHQFVGIDSFKMGNVNTNDFNYDMKKKFSVPNLCSSDKCKNCWVKFFCGGGCSANNWSFNNKKNEPHELSCELMKKRIELSIYLYAAKHHFV